MTTTPNPPSCKRAVIASSLLVVPLVLLLAGCSRACNKSAPTMTQTSPSAQPSAAPSASSREEEEEAEPVMLPPTGPMNAEHAALIAKNPAGVTFTIYTKKNQRRFKNGEKIPLVLRFTSSIPDTYKVELGTTDRSGRMSTETFRFSPSTVVDPLAQWFEGGRVGGGMRSRPSLGNTKQTVSIALNEWARFDEAGTYRFYVQSNRIEDAKTHSRSQAASSNFVEIEIENDPEWAAKELARVRPIVLTIKKPDDDGAYAARESLRFLNTKDAVRVMVDDYCSVTAANLFHTQMGLYGSRFREDVVAMLEEGFGKADCAITPEYLSLVKRMQPKAAREADLYDELHEKKLIAGLSAKVDAIAAVSARTALKIMGDREQREKKPHPKHDEVRAILARVFTLLPENDLAWMLELDWPAVRSPAMAPTLLTLVKEARPRGSQMRSVSDHALERLLDLDYEGARGFILSELGREAGARASFTGKTLARLKDTELPDLDAALLNGLKQPASEADIIQLRAEVVARYASKAIIDKVWAIYRADSHWRISLLSYFWRHDPTATELEIKKLESVDSLQTLSEYMWNSVVEHAVIDRLKTSSSDTSTASRILSSKGSAAAETALVERWREIHGAHSDKDRLAQELRNALQRGRGWMMTPDKLRTLAELCDDEMCKSELNSTIERWGPQGKKPDLVLWGHADGGVSGWLGPYDIATIEDLEMRIKQLPAGITLLWATKPTDVDAAIMDKARAWAAERKVSIVAKPDERRAK